MNDSTFSIKKASVINAIGKYSKILLSIMVKLYLHDC